MHDANLALKQKGGHADCFIVAGQNTVIGDDLSFPSAHSVTLVYHVDSIGRRVNIDYDPPLSRRIDI